MVPPCRTTAPTRGFGATRPQPRSARSRARPIASRSGDSLEAEAEPDASEDMARLGIEVGKVRGEVLVLPRLVPELSHKLEGGEAQSTVHERHLARAARVDDDGPHIGRAQWVVVESDARGAGREVIDAETGGEIYAHARPGRDSGMVVV